MLFAKIKSFTHDRKRKGSLKVIMLESIVLILYLKYLYLLCFDSIVVVEFTLEIYVCIYPKVFTTGCMCLRETSSHKGGLQQLTGSYIGQRRYFSVCELWVILSYWDDVARKATKAEKASNQPFPRAVVGYLVDTRYGIILLWDSWNDSWRVRNVCLSWKHSQSFSIDEIVSWR